MISYLRENLGLTYEDIAGYLSVSISAVSMAESGRRQLPVERDMKLIQLYTLLEELRKDKRRKPSPLPALVLRNEEKLANEIIRNTTDAAWKREVCEKKLARMRSLYDRSQTALEFLEKLSTVFPEKKQPTIESAWIKVQQIKHTQVLEKNSPLNQAKLMIQSAALLAEEEAGKAALKRLKM
jgi:transcriptional regulator with XRE-family HTH domain